MDLDILSLFKIRLANARLFAGKAGKYIETVKDAIIGTNREDYSGSQTRIASIGELADEILSRAGQNTIENFAVIYDRFTVIEGLMSDLTVVLHNPVYNKLALYNMSSTYTTNIHSERSLADSAHEKYREASVRDDDEIFEFVFAKVDIEKNIGDIFNFLLQEKSVNKFTIKLIGRAISLLTGDKRRRLEAIVETQKDAVLGATRTPLPAWRGPQSTIVRYGLTPVTHSMPAQEMFDSLGWLYDDSLSMDDNLRMAANNVGVMLINRANQSPVEFNLRSLADTEYIIKNNLKSNPIGGLNAKIINKFNTAKLLPTTSQDSIKRWPDNDRPIWRIFETISSAGIRMLGYYDGARICAEIPREKMVGLLSGISTRCFQYNQIQSSDILARCFDPRSQHVLESYAEYKSGQMSSEQIKGQLTEKLTTAFVARLSAQLSLRDFQAAMINKDHLTETLVSVLKHSTGTSSRRAPEYLLSYVAKIDAINSAFTKELMRQFDKATVKITERIFSEYDDAVLRKMLAGIYHGAVAAAIDELDRAKTWTDYDMNLKEYSMNQKLI